MASTAVNPTAETPISETDDIFVSAADGRRMFDEAARARLGISGEEFIRRYEAGEYADMVESEDNRYVVDLVLLIPFARQAG